jgi:flagellar motor switch protein FliG
MGNIRHAAIVLLSLPREEAAVLMSKLPPKQIEAVAIEIAEISELTAGEQEATIQEFAGSSPNALGSAEGGFELAKSLIEQALGKGARSTLENVQQSIEALPFGFLKKVDTQNVLTFIMEEHPQTIALILSRLPPATGAQILAELPPDRQLAVIQRIAKMGQTSPEVIREVEEGLETRMASLMHQSFENAGGVSQVAEILNMVDRGTERTLMENLSHEDAELVEEIRRLMFVFDDIAKLSDKDIQTVLKNVETSQWALALKGQSEELKAKVLGNMSKRAGDLLQEEMEYLGPVRVSEVEAEQQRIVDTVRQVEDAGEISIQRGDEDEQLIQ